MAADQPSPSRAIEFSGQYLEDAPPVGLVFWSADLNQIVVVVAVETRSINPAWNEDNDDFDPDGGGYRFTAWCRPATNAEAAPIRTERGGEQRRQEARRRAEEIKRRIKSQGERPAGYHLLEGERLLDLEDVCGGGDWFVVAADALWYVQGNGDDYDDWSLNNVRTRRAGGIGWRLPRAEAGDLVEVLRDLEMVINPGSSNDR